MEEIRPSTRPDLEDVKFHLQAFLASCLLVGAALSPHAPGRDIMMGFVFAAGVRFFITRRPRG